MEKHIEGYKDSIEKALENGTQLLEVNLLKDSEEILVSNSKFAAFDPNTIALQAFYFGGQPEVPGGIKIMNLKKVPPFSYALESKLSLSTEGWVEDIFLDSSRIFFQPMLSDNNSVLFAHYSVDQMKQQNIGATDIVAVDGLEYTAILGYRARIIPYSKVYRTYAKVLAQAIKENKRVLVNMDRRDGKQMLITIE